MGIIRKLFVLVTCMVTLAAVVTVGSTLTLRAVTLTLSAESRDAVASLLKTQALMEDLIGVNGKLISLMREKDPDEIEKLQADLAARQKDIEAQIAQRGAAGAGLAKAFQEWEGTTAKATDKFLRGDSAGAQYVLFSQAAPQFDEAIKQLRAFQQAHSAEAMADVTAAKNQAETRGLGLLAGATAGCATAGIWAWRMIRKSARALRNVAQVVDKGSDHLAQSAQEGAQSSEALARGAGQQAEAI